MPVSISRTFDGYGDAGIEGEVWPARHRGRRVTWKHDDLDDLPADTEETLAGLPPDSAGMSSLGQDAGQSRLDAPPPVTEPRPRQPMND